MGILRDLARALAYAHARGVMHRDIKPDNVLLSGGSAMVTDFGIAKALTAASADATRAGLTQTGLGIGTPAYMAPEQVTGDPGCDQRADIYSFGCLAYELFTGKPPFHGMPPHQVAAAQLGTTPRPVSELRAETPEAVAALIARCLAKDPGQRPQSARELLPALDGVATPPNVSVRRRTPVAVLVAAGLAAVAVIVLVAGHFVSRAVRSPTDPRATEAAASIPSIVVLPFTNVGGDSTNLPYSDGIADELTTALGKIEGLSVIARTSASKLKDEGLDAREIGRKLDVRYVVEGSVRRAANRRRVAADLMDVTTGKEVWSDRFEHDAQSRDVFTVQDSIIGSILRQILPRIPRAAIASSVKVSTENPEAHDLYLQGRFFFEKRDPASLLKAQKYFEQAIEKDSSYALAYGGLSEAYIHQWIQGNVSPRDVVPTAKAHASHALALDSTLAEVHTSLAVIALFYDWDWPTAGREFATAVRLNPGYAPAHRFRAHYFIATDSVSAAIDEARLAVRVDPFSSLNNARLISILFWATRYTEALGQAHKTFDLDSNFRQVQTEFATVYERLGRCEEALAALAPLSRAQSGAVRGYVYARCDRRARALAELDTLRAQIRAGKFVSHYTLASIQAGLGNKEQAFAELDSAYTERAWRMFLLKRDPVYEGLRSDPRFAVLVKKVGLAP
jgi:serine/threonine-protein kinase